MILLTQAPPIATPPPGVDLDTIIAQATPLVLGVVGLIVVGVVLYRFFKSDIAAALAERIRRRKKSSPQVEGVDAGHVAQLEQQIVVMQGQIAELAERVDFSERLLAQQRGEPLLKPRT